MPNPLFIAHQQPAPIPAWGVAAIIAGFFILFPLWWCFVVWLIGMKWRKLAAEFPSQWPPPASARLFHGQSGVLGWSRYSRVLTIAVTPTTLHLRPIAIFSFGHPPIAIPWDRFGELRDTGLFKGFSLAGAMVRLPDGGEIKIRLPRDVWAAGPLRLVN